MAAICLDFKWLDFLISDTIQNLVWISDPLFIVGAWIPNAQNLITFQIQMFLKLRFWMIKFKMGAIFWILNVQFLNVLSLDPIFIKKNYVYWI